MDYGFVHQDRVFTPNGSTVSAEENTARNAAIQAAEIAHWATQPEEMIGYYHFPAESGTLFGRVRSYRAEFRPTLFSYINQDTPDAPGTAQHATVSTWLGVTIGQITSARVYRHNFGGRFVSIRVTGTNGAEYHGRASYDNGSVIRLRKAR